MPKRVTRREMIKKSGLVGAGLWVSAGRAPGASRSPNERLAIAVIGCGGRGGANLHGVGGETIVALCDVDEKRAGRAFERYPKARRFRDFRTMLDAVHREIDAVVVSTPDHTHAVAAVAAMRLGKHCYCEKPLAHSVYECRLVTETAARYKVATQMGTQIHAEDNYRRVVELVRSGAIGAVGEVHVWHPGALGGQDRPTETPAVPAHLDWDLWLGPAPARPYHPCYVPMNWRDWWDFANGTLGDFGCHYMDLPFWALGLRYPESVVLLIDYGADVLARDFMGDTPLERTLRYGTRQRNIQVIQLLIAAGGAATPSGRGSSYRR